MSESLNIGDIVSHQFLKEAPEMYVAGIKEGIAVCRYFGAGIFHTEEFAFEELFTSEKCEVLHKLQAENNARHVRSLNNMFGGV